MRRPARHRRAFTLVELMLSLAVMTVLMGGMASAMLLATRAVPDRRTPLLAAAEGYHAAEQLTSELYAAEAFTTTAATTVDFTVADRNDVDTADETIRYSWSGVAGGALTREYNGGTAVAVVDDVYEFDLQYGTQSVGGATELVTVRIALRVGSDASARVETLVQTLNAPTVTLP